MRVNLRFLFYFILPNTTINLIIAPNKQKGNKIMLGLMITVITSSVKDRTAIDIIQCRMRECIDRVDYSPNEVKFVPQLY